MRRAPATRPRLARARSSPTVARVRARSVGRLADWKPNCKRKTVRGIPSPLGGRKVSRTLQSLSRSRHGATSLPRSRITRGKRSLRRRLFASLRPSLRMCAPRTGFRWSGVSKCSGNEKGSRERSPTSSQTNGSSQDSSKRPFYSLCNYVLVLVIGEEREMALGLVKLA